MRNSFTGKTALVTGGSKGIGRAICVEFARCGCRVIINYRSDEEGAQKTRSMVKEAGGEGVPARFDVTDAGETEQALNGMFSDYEAIDILINNAGINADGLFIMMSRDKWDRVIKTTLGGFYNVTKPVIEKMVRRKKGSVVSISSVAGVMGNRGQANYAAAKAGLIGASRSLASEVARLGIRVNVVAPGLIETAMIKDAPVQNIKQMIPMARIGRPEEVASVVRFLCSEDASYVTGQVISINGGMC